MEDFRAIKFPDDIPDKEFQDKINQSRNEFISSWTDIAQDNIEFMESVSAEFKKRNMPFVLFANPHGYVFNKEKAQGFWQFNDFVGDKVPLSKEANERLQKVGFPLIVAFTTILRVMFPTCYISMEDKKTNDVIVDIPPRL